MADCPAAVERAMTIHQALPHALHGHQPGSKSPTSSGWRSGPLGRPQH